MSDVALSAALRSNLLSLQQTQSLIDITQFRLSTGRKVNSALDNPQNFFASQALNNRASDLNRLLDGLGQSIQVLKEADAGITALTSLVEQADSIATSARDELNNASQEARITGDVDLSDVTDLTNLSGISNGDSFRISIVDSDGTAVTTATLTINAGDSAGLLAQQINDIHADISAEINGDGFLEVAVTSGGSFRIDNVSLGGGATEAANIAGANALGLGDFFGDIDPDAAAATDIQASVVASSSLVSTALEDAGGDALQRSDLLKDAVGFTLGAAGAVDAKITLTDNTGGTVDITLNDSTTVQDFIDDINEDSDLNITATYDEATGEITLRASDAAVTNLTIEAEVVTGAPVTAFGFGTGNSDTSGGNNAGEYVTLGAAAGRLAELEQDYDSVLAQIDQLVADTDYRGTNLLNGDDLVSDFNEDGSSALTTEGVTFTSNGLSLSAANFANRTTVASTISETSAALETVRNFGSSIANDLSIIQTRQEFTKQTINTLEEGSDKLTLADQNEEGAKLLALQTRQQLGVTSLALASQSQQSVLRLF